MTTIDRMTPDAKRLLDAARDLKHLKSFADIGRLLGESDQTMTNWKRRGVPKDKTVEICRKIGCRPEWLETGTLPMAEGAHLLPSSDFKVAEQRAHFAVHKNIEPAPDIKGRIPLISGRQAGMWTEAVDIYEPGYAERWLPILKSNSEHTFALRVTGDSMTARFGKSYPEGCIVFVDPDQRNPENGDRIVAKLAGSDEVTLKVFTQEAGRRWLRPLNDSYPPIYDEFTVVGKVVGKWEDE